MTVDDLRKREMTGDELIWPRWWYQMSGDDLEWLEMTGMTGDVAQRLITNRDEWNVRS